MGREASKRYSRIAEMLSKKRDEPYSITMSWIRRKLSFSLMRLIIMYIRGSRTFKSNEEKQCISQVASYCDWQSLFLRKNVLHQQVEIFNKTLLNIFHNYIPNTFILCDDKDPPWINEEIKYLI